MDVEQGRLQSGRSVAFVVAALLAMGCGAAEPGLEATPPAPAPLVSSIDPVYVGRPAATGWTLRVLGDSFVARSVVRVHGANRQTTFVSPHELQVVVEARDLPASGDSVAVAVFTPAPGGGLSASRRLARRDAPRLASADRESIQIATWTTVRVVGDGLRADARALVAGAEDAGFVVTSPTSAAIGLLSMRAEPVTVRIISPPPADAPSMRPDTSNAITVSVEYPMADILRVEPLTLPVGGTSVVLRIEGAGFRPESMLLWNGAARIPVIESSTALRYAVPAADLVGPGSVTLAIRNPTPGGGVSRAVVLAIR